MTDDAEIKGFDPFAILGVTPSTEAREIKKQYRALSLIYHPDKVREAGSAACAVCLVCLCGTRRGRSLLFGRIQQ